MGKVKTMDMDMELRLILPMVHLLFMFMGLVQMTHTMTPTMVTRLMDMVILTPTSIINKDTDTLSQAMATIQSMLQHIMLVVTLLVMLLVMLLVIMVLLIMEWLIMEWLIDMVLGMELHNLLLEVALDMDMDTDMVMATSAITKVPKLTGCDDKMD